MIAIRNIAPLLAVLSCLTAAQAATLPVRAVTVYPSGAYVERSGTVDLASGDQLLAIEGMPSDINESTVTAEIDGVQLLDLSVRTRQHSESVEGRIRELDRRIADLEWKKKGVQHRIDVATSRSSYFTALSKTLSSNFPADYFKQPSDPRRFDEADRVTSAGLAASFDERLAAERERDAITAEIALLHQERDAIGTHAGTQTKDVVLRLRSPRQDSRSLKLRYFRSGAGWQARYRGDTDVTAGRLTLGMQAIVRQSGGEDWTDVRVTVSSAAPAVEGTPPVPTPWVVDFLPEPRPYLRASKSAHSEAMAAASAPLEFKEAADEAAPAFEPAPAPTFVGRGLSYQFTSGVPVTIPPGPAGTAIELQSVSVDAAYRYRILPDYSTAAYLIADATLPDTFPVLPATILLYSQGIYTGRAETGFTPPGGKLVLPAGIDRQVSVEKKQTVLRHGTEGVFSKQQVQDEGYRIIVANPHNRAVSIELLCRLPLSRNTVIVVKPVRIEPATAATESETGFIVWKDQLPALGTGSFSYEFTITSPSDRRITRF